MTGKGRGRSSLSGLIPSVDYHSAQKPPLENLPEVDRVKRAGCLAFVYDVMADSVLPPEFDRCDVLVADLPWRTGFDRFNQRAGVDDGRTYAAFMARVAELVESATVPTYLITGKHAVPMLPEADAVVSMRLNEDQAVAIGYRVGLEVSIGYDSAPEFLRYLAEHYRMAGDFCCGYGRTARIFLKTGKQAVVSDFNAQCIGYISEHLTEWAGNG